MGPDTAERNPTAEPPVIFAGDYFTSSVPVDPDQRTACKCADAGYHLPGNDYFSEPRADVHRRRTRVTRDARRSDA